jgi:hypothetical protein
MLGCLVGFADLLDFEWISCVLLASRFESGNGLFKVVFGFQSRSDV